MEISSNLALCILFFCGCIWGFTGVALNKHVEFDDPRDHDKKSSKKKSNKTSDEENQVENTDTETQVDKKPEPLMLQLLKNCKFILFYGLQ
jgi:hypothetical protein